MPKLPGFESQQNIQANTAAPLRQPDPLRNDAAQSFQDDQKVLGTLQTIAQTMSTQNDVVQYTEAKSKHAIAVADIEARAKADPNFKDSDKYHQELAKANSSATAGITNQLVASKASREFAFDSQIAAIKINENFQAKKLLVNKVNVTNTIEDLTNKRAAAQSGSPLAQQYDHNIISLLEENLQAGNLNMVEANKILEHAEYKAAENLVYSNPEEAIQRLKHKDLGLSEKQTNKLIDDAGQIIQKRKKIADYQLQQTQTQSAIELSDALSNNTLNPMMVRDMQQKGLIDTETAAIFDSIALKKTYETPESTSLAEPDYFLRLLDDSMGDKKQIKKVMTDAAKAYGEHKIGTNQYLYFVQNAKQTFDRQSKGIFTNSKEQNLIESAIKGIKDFSSSFFKKDEKKPTAEMTVTFFDRYKPGDDPHKIKNQIINEAVVQKKPEISNIPTEGKIMVDKHGNKAKVFPDGHYEEVK